MQTRPLEISRMQYVAKKGARLEKAGLAISVKIRDDNEISLFPLVNIVNYCCKHL